MALINCPECREIISSAEEACPHCGCKVVVCPECGKASVFSADYCAECGYVFKKASAPKEQNQQNQQHQQNNADMEKFKQRIDINRTLLKAIKYSYAPIVVLSLILVVALPALIIYIWTPQGKLDDLLRIKDTCNTLKVLSVCGSMILAVAASIIREGEGIVAVFFGMWLRKNNYDLAPYINKPDGENEFKKYLSSKDFENVSSSAYLSKDPQAGAILIGKCIAFVILVIVACVYIGQAFTILWNCAYLYRIEENINSIDINDAFISLFIFFAIMIIALIIEMILAKVFQSKKESWIKDLARQTQVTTEK